MLPVRCNLGFRCLFKILQLILSFLVTMPIKPFSNHTAASPESVTEVRDVAACTPRSYPGQTPRLPQTRRHSRTCIPLPAALLLGACTTGQRLRSIRPEGKRRPNIRVDTARAVLLVCSGAASRGRSRPSGSLGLGSVPGLFSAGTSSTPAPPLGHPRCPLGEGT